jgi:NAD(P)-dependent dehydrogenase (short-subunit alcohol dehydrogenase family)
MSKAQAVAVITGASRGIGAALVETFRNRNYRVVATSRSIKPCRDEGLVTVKGDGTSDVPEQDRLANAIVWGLGEGAGAGDGAAAIIKPVTGDLPIWDLGHEKLHTP